MNVRSMPTPCERRRTVTLALGSAASRADDDALEDLRALAVPLDDFGAHPHGVADAVGGDVRVRLDVLLVSLRQPQFHSVAHRVAEVSPFPPAPRDEASLRCRQSRRAPADRAGDGTCAGCSARVARPRSGRGGRKAAPPAPSSRGTRRGACTADTPAAPAACDSSASDSSEPRTPGSRRTTTSMSTIAGSSPPERT